MTNAALGSPGTPLPDSLRDRLRAFVERVGETAAARRLGSRQTLARALAGFGVRRGTAALYAQVLDAADGANVQDARSEVR